MYHLNKFCNIIFELRKERGWTQTMLAEKLGIAPQSISKWECGIGYPDVTLFPLIAELSVLILVFFLDKAMKITRI
ncbi:MAG: helix-turn-helix transcriptional regulator [Clostridia bacterium]|nr:helix-turn-helix transcriptional regulator [Clostridia bacterium]